MKWPEDDSKPCDGARGVDAARLLQHASLRDALRSAVGGDFRSVDLATSDLTRLTLTGLDLRCANLRHATIDNAHLLRCDLRRADLRAVTLHGTTISACDLRHADLRGADLRGARLGDVQDHDGHRGCNLERAQLDDANLVGVRYTADTVWPEGFRPHDAGAEIIT